VFGEVLEELGDGEEDGGVVLFYCAVFFDAEDTSIQWLVHRVSTEMGFGDELLTEANPIVTVDAAGIQEAVFFDVVPAYFV
jgi:hypothetical protein